MSIEEYIASGVLESYVIGELDSEEMRKVECMALVHDEIGKELKSIELAFESMSLEESVEPSDGLKEDIWASIQGVDTPADIVELNSSPTEGAEDKEGWTINWKTAASVALIFGLGAVSYNQWSGKNQLSEELSASQASNASLQAEVSSLGAQQNTLAQQLDILRDPAMTPVILNGTDNAPDALAKVYWNPASQAVYLDVLAMNELPEGMVYQLWALDEGQPIDAGTFRPEAQGSLLKMKDITAGQAFAVTIEKEGGVEVPSLETLQVIGELET